MKLQGLKILFLGDSITEGAGTSAGDKRFFELLAARYGTVSQGYGIGGTRIARQQKPSVCERWDLYFASRIPQMDPDADLIVVFGGTNDYGHGDAPIGQMSDRTPDTFYGACHDLVLRLWEKYPGKPLVFMTPLHRVGEDTPKAGYGDATLETYVDILRQVAAYYAIPVLDLFRTSGIQPNLPLHKELFCPDGLHPNDRGNSLICERLAGFLSTL